MDRRTLLTSVAVSVLAAPAVARDPVRLRAGMVTGIDQVGLPIALERGFFEEEGLEVTIARPYATGVDALNALQAGEVDTVQVGVPMIGAVVRGMDLVALGNYSGSATRMGSDATMAVVARAGSGIDPANLASLKGKKIAASFGTINHLYILALLEKAGLTPADVTLVNTPPPDMTVALLTGGVDAMSCWDPWPIIALRDVPGAVLVQRGGDIIAYLGFNVTTRRYAEANRPTLVKFLAALAKADQWMRKNPDGAAEVATRWIPGLALPVAKEAMKFNIEQNDRRLSAANYMALHKAMTTLHRLGFLPTTFDVNRHIDPRPILEVMASRPELFADLPPIPEALRIREGWRFEP
jgi:ABC-type nitrate/sulfonate/bicarbonate transport system substrate-binding protein